MEGEARVGPESYERGENFSSTNEVVLDLIRHGSSHYHENQLSHEEKTSLGDERPNDLTDEGVEDVKTSFEQIVERIDPENEIIVTWSSPSWRGLDTMALLKIVLEERGIDIYKESVIPTIRNFDQHDAEYLNGFWKELAKSGRSPEVAYPLDEQFQIEDPRFESYPEVRKRSENAMRWVNFLAENSNIPEGKKLHIIAVSHSEIINPILENIYGHAPEDEAGIKKGESARLDFKFDKTDRKMEISSDFHGQHKEGLKFDAQSRRFVEEDE